MRIKHFCWLPTKVYLTKYWRNGFRWLSFGWLDHEDGKIYETKEALEVDFDQFNDLLGEG